MTLTDDDLKSLKDLMEFTIEETVEKMELATKIDINNLPSKDEFYKATSHNYLYC